MIDLSTLKDNLRNAEGYRSYPYTDSQNILTIGYGFNISRSGPGLPKGVAEAWLASLILAADTELTAAYPWYSKMIPARCNAICELFYQLGPDRFASFEKMIAALARSDYRLAHDELLNSVYAKQVPSRANRLAAAIANG